MRFSVNATLLSVLVGAAVTLLPNLLGQMLQQVNSSAQRKHEMRLKQYDALFVPQIEAIARYREKLGTCMGVASKDLDPHDAQDLLQDYYSAYESVYPYLSSATQALMEALGDPFDWAPSDSDLSELNKHLSDDVHHILNEALRLDQYFNPHPRFRGD